MDTYDAQDFLNQNINKVTSVECREMQFVINFDNGTWLMIQARREGLSNQQALEYENGWDV